MSGEVARGVAPGLERLRELLTGRLTVEALEETTAILRGWAEQPRDQWNSAAKEISVLLDGAGQWIEGWQGCLEELRSRRAADEFGREWDGQAGRTLVRG